MMPSVLHCPSDFCQRSSRGVGRAVSPSSNRSHDRTEKAGFFHQLSPSVFISRCRKSRISPPCHQDNCRWRVCVFVVFVVTQTPAAVTQTVVSGVVLGRLICPSPFFFHYERLSDLLVVTNSSANRERSTYSAPCHQASDIAWATEELAHR